jgi:DNA-binding NarL/FixJ family response regulator
MDSIRLAIADDHALFRQGLLSMLGLQSGIEVAIEIERASDLLTNVQLSGCDILLLDLQMERSSLADIEALVKRVAIIVVTASERVDDAVMALRAGARGVVFKRFALETLMTAIDAVMHGEVWLPPVVQAAVAAQLQQPAIAGLTRREREVIRQVALGLRNAEVAVRLGISDVTVKTHLNNIFQKVGVRGRVELALYAIRMGIIGAHERGV